MEVIDERVAQRRANFDFYEKQLSEIEEISFQPEANGSFANRWLSCILVNPKTNGVNRETIRLALETQNIETRPLWKPMHLQPIFRNAPYYGSNVCEQFFNDGLCLPSGSNLTKDDRTRIVAAIFDAIKS